MTAQARTDAPRERVGIVHVHSDYSSDGHDSLEEIREFALVRGIQWVALSDHAEDFNEEIFAHYAAECHRLSDAHLRLYPGLEYRFEGFKGLHLLAFDLRRFISPATPSAFLAEAPGACALTVAAHPVLYRHHVPNEVAERIDAVEVWNATYNTRYLPDMEAIAMYLRLHRRRPELRALAGLDQHDASNDRELRVIVQGDPRTSPFDLIRAGSYRNTGRSFTLTPTIDWNTARLGWWRAVRWGFDRVERVQERLALRRRRRLRQR